MDALDTLPCPVLVTDRYGRISAVNTSLLELVGGNSQQWCGQPMEGMLPVPSRIFLQTHLLPMVLHDGHLEEIKMEVVDRHGVRTPLLVNCKRTVNEDIESYHWVLFVSRERSKFESELLEARNRAEASARALAERERTLTVLSRELLAAQEKVRLATESGAIGIWESNLVTGAVLLDAQSYRLFGLEPRAEALTYDFWAAQVHPDDLGAAEAAFQRTLSTGADFFNEFRVVWADGSVHHLRGFGRPGRDADGRAVSIVGTNIDVTEAVQHAQSLKEARDLAEAANLAKSQFLSTMSHEIRTPMNGVMGMAQVLLQPNISDTNRLDYARSIYNSGQTLMGLLNDILDLSRIEAGKIELETILLEPEQVIGETTSVFKQLAQDKGLHFEAQWSGPERRYLGDTNRLRQMLSNLVGNAIKFTRQGSIRIEAREIAVTGKFATLEFAVMDTGVGIAKDKQVLLFQSFSQVDSSTTRNYGGSGLGLSIVRKFAEAMGGEVGIESDAGLGSRFWFRVQLELPAADAPIALVATQPDASLTTQWPQLSGRVLVIEDVPINQILMRVMLEKMGLEVAVANDGQQALDALMAGEGAQLVLTDLQMPVMDGYIAAQRIRHWEAQMQQKRHPIIALSADAFAGVRERCLAAGMDEMLSKPVKFGELWAVLKRWLPAAPVEALIAPVPTVQKAVDPVAIVALLTEILPLLTLGKANAIGRFKTLQELVAGSELEPEVAEAALPLKKFRFDLALERLRQMASKYEWSITP